MLQGAAKPHNQSLLIRPSRVGSHVVKIVNKDHPANPTPLGSYHSTRTTSQVSAYLTLEYMKNQNLTSSASRPSALVPVIEFIFSSETYVSTYIQRAYSPPEPVSPRSSLSLYQNPRPPRLRKRARVTSTGC